MQHSGSHLPLVSACMHQQPSSTSRFIYRKTDQPNPQLIQNTAGMGLRKDRIGIGIGETATEGETGIRRGRAGGLVQQRSSIAVQQNSRVCVLYLRRFDVPIFEGVNVSVPVRVVSAHSREQLASSQQRPTTADGSHEAAASLLQCDEQLGRYATYFGTRAFAHVQQHLHLLCRRAKFRKQACA